VLTRQEITDRLAYERASTEAQSIADSISKDLKTTADMERVSAARGFKMQESGFFLKDEPIAGLGPSPEVSELENRILQHDPLLDRAPRADPWFGTAAGSRPLHRAEDGRDADCGDGHGGSRGGLRPGKTQRTGHHRNTPAKAQIA